MGRCKYKWTSSVGLITYSVLQRSIQQTMKVGSSKICINAYHHKKIKSGKVYPRRLNNVTTQINLMNMSPPHPHHTNNPPIKWQSNFWVQWTLCIAAGCSHRLPLCWVSTEIDKATNDHSNNDNACNGDANDQTNVTFLGASDINSTLRRLEAGNAIADFYIRYLGQNNGKNQEGEERKKQTKQTHSLSEWLIKVTIFWGSLLFFVWTDWLLVFDMFCALSLYFFSS